jgi:hypothetical protein
MKKTIIIGLIIMATFFSGNAFAGNTSAVMQVNARVLPFAKYNVLHQEKEFVVTEADLNRGYVYVPSAMVLSVRTNSSNGYLIMVSVASGPFNELVIYDGNASYNISDSGGELYMPYEGLKPVKKDLSFRLRLNPDASPGVYQLPVAIMVSAM